MAIRLEEIENSFPDAPDSTEVEMSPPAIQQLLVALSEGGEMGEQETPSVAQLTDDEGSSEVLDISALSASLLTQFDDADQRSGVHLASSLVLEGHGLSHLRCYPILFSLFVGA